MKTILATTMALGLVTAVSFSQPVAASSLGAGLTSQSASQILLVRSHGGGGGHFGGDHAGNGGRGDIGGYRAEASRAIHNHPNAAEGVAKYDDGNHWRRDNALGAEGALGTEDALGVDGVWESGDGGSAACYHDDAGNLICESTD